MSAELMELHRMLTESLQRDEELSEQLRALVGDDEIESSSTTQAVPANLDLQALTRALVECMEDTVDAMEEVQAVLNPVDNNNNSPYFPDLEDDKLSRFGD